MVKAGKARCPGEAPRKRQSPLRGGQHWPTGQGHVTDTLMDGWGLHLILLGKGGGTSV